MKFWKYFEDILERPAIYIGFKSVTRLKAYMDGYLTALDQVTPSAENFNMEFNKWVSTEDVASSYIWLAQMHEYMMWS